MARLLRLQYEGALYHVMFRGNERRVIFRDDIDRRRFLQRVQETQALRPVRLYQVCLMPNHAHLLLETPQPNLSAFMGRLLTAYAGDFNRRHRRVGHLTQGRYKAQLVEGEAYLLRLSRYIHLNPVAGERWAAAPVTERRQALRDFRWSTYRSYIGLEPPWENVEYDPLLATVAHQQPGRARDTYRDYVEAGLAQDDEEFAVLYRTARLALGSEEDVEAMRQRHEQARIEVKRQEDVALRRGPGRHSPEEVLHAVARVMRKPLPELKRRRRHSLLRPAAAWALQRFACLNQRETAELLGIGTGAAVSRQLARWGQGLAGDPRVRRIAEAVGACLG
jgi:REP element-mobilizing transposase RayT